MTAAAGVDVGLFQLHQVVEWGTTIRGQVRRVTGRIALVVPAGKRPADLARITRAQRPAGLADPPVAGLGDVRLEDDEGARDHESYVVRGLEGGVYWPRVSALAQVGAGVATTDHDRAELRAAEVRAFEVIGRERDLLRALLLYRLGGHPSGPRDRTIVNEHGEIMVYLWRAVGTQPAIVEVIHHRAPRDKEIVAIYAVGERSPDGIDWLKRASLVP